MSVQMLKFMCEQGHAWYVDAATVAAQPGLSCPVCQAPGWQIEGTNSSVADETSYNFPGFEIIRELGRGGMGVVYLAISLRDGQQVALKALPHAAPDALHRFKREFRALQNIAHPNLIALHELHSDGSRWFFTMEYVPGLDLFRYVQSLLAMPPSEPLDRDKTSILTLKSWSPDFYVQIRQVFAQLSDVIATLHAAGILHRDIKPTNVIVTPTQRVVLLDFGLVTTWGDPLQDSIGSHAVGTLSYMAPEQAAGAPVPASDWYSMGVMLHESLTGHRLFDGDTWHVWKQKTSVLPNRPIELQPTTPADLDELCMKLLAAEPADRPSDEEVRRCLHVERTPGLPSAAVVDCENIDLIGRERHLAELQDAYVASQRGQPLSLFVVGHSGAGKSALVEHFLDEIAAAGHVTVLRGRCYEQESVAFKALDGLIDDLTRHLRSLPPEVTAAIAPRDSQSLVQVFPVLGRVATLAAMPARTGLSHDRQELRRRAAEALREMFSRIGDRGPLVVFIDDLQWGDKDSAELLFQVLRPPDAPRLFFVGAYRQEDAASSAFVSRLAEQRIQGEQHFQRRMLTVAALSHEEAVALAARLLGGIEGAVGDRAGVLESDRSALAEQIATESGGIPFFVRELAMHRRRGDRAANASTALDRVSLDEVIWARVQALPDDSRELLKVVAVAGRPVSLTWLSECLATVHDLAASTTVSGRLRRLRVENLLRFVDSGEASTVEAYHDRIRESVIHHLEATRKRAIHRRLAIAWEAAGNVEVVQLAAAWGEGRRESPSGDLHAGIDWTWVCDLAWHFSEAGETDRALPYAMWAASRAHAQHALEIAEQHYRIAARGADRLDKATRCRIAEGLGDVLMLRGNYPTAAEQFEAARAAISDTAGLARIEGKIGELALKRGDAPGACRAIERALELMRVRVPRTSL